MNVRWDAVIDRIATEVDIEKVPPSSRRLLSSRRAGDTRVHVQLFGALASASAERSIQLELPSTATIADVLAALGRRLGESFLARVLDQAGAKHRHCRFFVDGHALEDLQGPIDATNELTQIEIILLIAPEGG
jgi:hypothetical protein